MKQRCENNSHRSDACSCGNGYQGGFVHQDCDGSARICVDCGRPKGQPRPNPNRVI